MQDEKTSIPPPTSSTLPSADPKYAVLAELGRGGMATAYLASMRGPGGFNKLVVVKRLRASLAAEPEFLRMFLEEARLSARIDHPNVVHTSEVGFDGKNHYIAMEYLDGQSFESVSRRLLKLNKPATNDGPQSLLGGEAWLPLKFHLHVISQALLGLDCAHELKDFDGAPLNVVHRDVSPHNIVVTYDGHVKLLDFGIAKAADSSGDTRTGVMKGKCAYMPAEQFGGKQIDRRADIFAVGVILWQALTGRRLWRGLSDAEIFQRVAAGDIKSPSSVKPDVPPELDAICMKALSRQAEDRFATAADFQVELDDYINAHPEVRTTSRDLGKFIADLFEDDRARMKSIIEAQVGKSSGARSASIPVLGVTSSHSGASYRSDGSPLASNDVAATPPVSAPRNPRLLVAIALAVTATVVLASAGLYRRYAHPAAASSLPAPVAPPATTAAEEAVTTSLVHVRSSPPGARLSFDGAALDGNPASSTFRRDGLSHRVEADAPGFVHKAELVTLNSAEVTVVLDLETMPTAPDAGRLAVGRAVTAKRQSEAPAAPPVSSPPAAAPVNSASFPGLGHPTSHGPVLDKADPWAPAAGH